MNSPKRIVLVVCLLASPLAAIAAEPRKIKELEIQIDQPLAEAQRAFSVCGFEVSEGGFALTGSKDEGHLSGYLDKEHAMVCVGLLSSHAKGDRSVSGLFSECQTTGKDLRVVGAGNRSIAAQRWQLFGQLCPISAAQCMAVSAGECHCLLDAAKDD